MRTHATFDSNQDASVDALLHVSGVDTPIHARVTRQSERGMTVEQALPFLQLHTQVWDATRQASRIESVSVVVYDGMPRLVLDLAFDPEADDAGAVHAVHAEHAEHARSEMNARSSSVPPPLPRRAHAGVVRPRMRVDQTQSFDRNEVVQQAAAALETESAEQEVSIEPAQVEVSREPTQLFLTQLSPQLSPEERLQETEGVQRAKAMGLSLNSMEQELLTPKDFVYHAKLAWLRAEPHVLRAREQGLVLSRVAYAKARPWLVRVARASAVLLAAAGRKVAGQVRARMRSRASAVPSQPGA
jgi:hypothetical protein